MFYYIFILLLFCCDISVQAFSFFYEPLYFTEQELRLLKEDQERFEQHRKTLLKKDRRRLELLQKLERNIYWHLHDSMTNISSQAQKKLSPHKDSAFFTKDTRLVRLAIFDTPFNDELGNVKVFCQECYKIRGSGAKNKFDPMCFGQCEKLLKIDEMDVKNFELSHSFSTIQIIRQIAPDVEIFVIPIADRFGRASKQDLITGLEVLRKMDIDIVHLGFKFTGTFNVKKNKEDKKIVKLLKNIPYVVAAAGNDGVRSVSYPACLDCVSFSVGAYDYNYNICDFSQYEPYLGPKVVAPGSQVFCQGIIPGLERVIIMNNGTSVSASMITGFLAKILTEFGQYFTRKEILTMIYRCTRKLKKDWEDKVVYGAIDMPKTFNCFIKLRELQYQICPKKFKKKFEEYLNEVLKKV